MGDSTEGRLCNIAITGGGMSRRLVLSEIGHTEKTIVGPFSSTY